MIVQRQATALRWTTTPKVCTNVKPSHSCQSDVNHLGFFLWILCVLLIGAAGGGLWQRWLLYDGMCCAVSDIGVQVKNVLVYVSEMQRSFTDRMRKDFFNDPSQVRCQAPS
jgi:hypothetical protein